MNAKKKIMIEVGSCHGEDGLRFYNNNYKVFCFEPNKESFKKIRQKVKSLEDFKLFNKAISSKNGKAILNIANCLGACSLLSFKSDNELKKHWGEKYKKVCFSGKTQEVETIRLDTFIEQQKLEESIIDYLWIDAQGMDFEVLKSLGKYIKNLKEGVLEAVYFEEKSIYLNKNSNKIYDIKKFLEENNFKIEKIENNDKQNCEFNIYFKK